MKLDKNKKYGLSLAGGGFKGSYQAGVIQALHDEGYEFSAIVGTSVGALNGVLVAQGDFDKMKAMWHSEESKYVFGLDSQSDKQGENNDTERAIKLNLNDINIFEIGKKIFDFAQSKGIDSQILMDMIKRDSDEKSLREKDAKFGLVAINLTDKKVEEIMLDEMPEGQLADYLLATAFLPVFKKRKLHGKYYLDGGYINNTPTNMLVERGYKDIIEIRLSNKDKVKRFNANVTTLLPTEDLGQSIIYNQDKIANNYKLGYFEGLRFAKNAHGYKYLIEGEKTESFFVSKFLELEANIIFEYDIDMEKYESIEKAIISELVYDLAKKLDLKKSFSYEKLYISIIEYAANYLEIERFKPYKFDEFEKLILDNYDKEKCQDRMVHLAINLIS